MSTQTARRYISASADLSGNREGFQGRYQLSDGITLGKVSSVRTKAGEHYVIMRVTPTSSQPLDVLPVSASTDNLAQMIYHWTNECANAEAKARDSSSPMEVIWE